MISELLLIVRSLSYRYAIAASTAILLGECQYLVPTSFVFDEQTDPSPSYRRLHICLNILDSI
jgi:hypothetical protein